MVPPLAFSEQLLRQSLIRRQILPQFCARLIPTRMTQLLHTTHHLNTDPDSLLGETLGAGYRIVARLGAGGMGVVYRAWDHTADRYAVIKVPRKALLTDPTFLSRFDQEISALRLFIHPNIVPIIDVGRIGDCPFVVMPYLAGGNLSQRRPMSDGRPLPAAPSQLHRWLVPFADALDHIHDRDYVHRDIKPDNMLFNGLGIPALGDFGIAKVVAHATLSDQTPGLTGTGFALGTPEYMAPELIEGAKPSRRVDQYALAVMVYEFLAAKKPILGPTPSATMVAQVNQQPPSLKKLLPHLPDSLCEAVHQAMAKKPADRFASCRTFADFVLLNVAALPAEKRLRLMCPACGHLISIQSDWAGKNGNCPACTNPVFIAPNLESLIFPADRIAAKVGPGRATPIVSGLAQPGRVNLTVTPVDPTRIQAQSTPMQWFATHPAATFAVGVLATLALAGAWAAFFR